MGALPACLHREVHHVPKLYSSGVDVPVRLRCAILALECGLRISIVFSESRVDVLHTQAHTGWMEELVYLMDEILVWKSRMIPLNARSTTVQTRSHVPLPVGAK